MNLLKKIKNKKIFILYIFLILCFSVFLMIFLNKEFDYFWHIKAGEHMVKNHKILTTDIFSWYLEGKYWFSHEWLFEVIIYLLSLIFNKSHIFIYCFSSTLLLLIILFLTNRKEYLKNIPFSLLWISLSGIFMYFIQCRPHLISYSFLALTIWILYDLYKNENSKKYLFLPFIALIWANIHGGSSNLPYLLSLVFLISGIFNFSYSKIEAKRYTKKQFLKYLLIIIMCILFSCINPHGIKMLFYPYQNIADSFMLKTIGEWQPTNLNVIFHYGYFILLFVVVCVFIFSHNKIKLIDLLLFCIVLFLGLKSIRFWPYTYIVMTYVIFYYILPRKKDNGTEILLIIFCFILLSLFFVNKNKIINSLNKKILTDDVIYYLKDISPEKLYNYYDYGGYLIYNDIDVFIDGRADLYSKYNYKDSYSISELSFNYDKLIDKYKFDYFVIPKRIGLATYLNNNNNYELVFYDENTVIYKFK